MKQLLIATSIWFFTIPLLLIFRKRERLCGILAAAGILMGSVLSISSSLNIVLSNLVETITFKWSFIIESATLKLDPLAAFFIIPICLLCSLAAIYGIGYESKSNHGLPQYLSWIMFILLLMSMFFVIIADNGIVFLISWEIMAVSSFFLVIRDYTEQSAQDAGWLYLIATHLGTIFLIILFLYAAVQTGSFSFSLWAKNGLKTPSSSLLFLFAVIGFGTKAGFFPLHVWLPEAHPAAPSHISAVMSGVMIKTGIYGLMRTLTWLGPVIPHWWGVFIIFAGIISGVVGVLFALAQHDLKRLLAYHSVENIGIISIGLGVGIIGMSYSINSLTFLGFTGALLHTLNHSIFKGLLFLGAGSILHSTGERNIDKMGGLLKRMPLTGAAFLVGSMAIVGLPPFNGFISELAIFISGVNCVLSNNITVVLCGASLVAGLALIGGLAAACFDKAFGIIFVGEPRSEKCLLAKESPLPMVFSMLILAALCLLIGLSGFLVISIIPSAVQTISGMRAEEFLPYQNQFKHTLILVSAIGGAVILLSALFCIVRNGLLSKRSPSTAPTWDCGYIKPTAKMQYTASSFAQPFLELFKFLLRTKSHIKLPERLFPKKASFHSETPDIAHTELYRPLFSNVNETLARFKFFQHGYIQLYILYIALALIALIVWKF